MGFRFRKSIKIFPGVKINLSKKGISSVTVGRRGASVNIGTDGKTRATVGVPGTGISYQKRLDTPAGKGLTACPFCGHRMRKRWDACPKCGSALVQEEAPRLMTKQEIIANMTPEERQEALERGKKKLRRYVLIGAVILGLLIGSCMRDAPDKEPPAAKQQVTQSQQSTPAPAKKKSLASEIF